MKKLTALLTALLLCFSVFGITACKGGKPQTVANPTDGGETLAHTEYKKVFILAGQSNASGVSSIEALAGKVDSQTFAAYAVGYANVKISYHVDGGNNLSDGFVPTALGQGCTVDYFGPEVGFAKVISSRTDADVYIIKYSYGGTQLETQWLDGNGNRGELYLGMVDYVRTEIAKLGNAKIVGMLWMQGESDGFSDTANRYYDNQKAFVNYARTDLADLTAPAGMIFVDAGIAGNWNYYAKINNAKIKLANESPLNGYFSTTENGLTNTDEPAGNPDRAHYDSLSEITLGEWFAYESLALLASLQ